MSAALSARRIVWEMNEPLSATDGRLHGWFLACYGARNDRGAAL
jgi:hypothetical protein